jgi:hypothetical protein
MSGFLDEELVAAYEVRIEGVERTRKQLALLDNEVKLLRKTKYNSSVKDGSATTAAGTTIGRQDIFVSELDKLDGRVQASTAKIMAANMAIGKKVQATALRQAVTPTGLRGQSHSKKGRKGPGREDSGDMINRLATNVETSRTSDSTTIVGWHGWAEDRSGKIDAQERGTKARGSKTALGSMRRLPNKPTKKKSEMGKGKGVPAANSLGKTIPLIREQLKMDLSKLR